MYFKLSLVIAKFQGIEFLLAFMTYIFTARLCTVLDKINLFDGVLNSSRSQ